MDDFYEDDFFEDEFDDGFEMVEDNPINDGNDGSEIEDGSLIDDFSIEDAMFWGGYLGINIDEEREDRRLAKKLERESEPENILNSEDKEEDY